MLKYFFAVVLFFNSHIIAQDYLKLYRQHIPENILTDEVLSKSLDLNLKRNAELNPELIYLTLKYYQQYDGSKFDTKLFEILKSNERVWLSARTQWAKNTIEKLIATENHEIIRNAEPELNKLVIVVRSKEDDKLVDLTIAEKQLRDFYIVMFYNKDSKMKFDENTDYSYVRSQIESDKKRYFAEVKENPELLTSPAEIVNNVTDNWYLLLDDKNIEASELLINSISDVILDKSRKKYSVFIGGVFVNTTINFEESITFPGIDYIVNMNKYTSLPQFSLGVGYKLYFDKKSFFLSYVDIQGYYSKGYSEERGEESVVYNNTVISGSFTTQELIRNFDDEFKLSSLNSYGLKLSLPIFENSFLRIEGGFNFSYNSYIYTPNMHFTYAKYRTEYGSNGQPIFRETLALGTQTITDEIKKEYFAFIPSLDVSIKIDSRFGVKMIAGYNYAALNIFYNTALFF
ncbi:MAG: hypothetical protein KBF59_08615 [Ignavibacterium sp.]|nr:hypothetical protein [Ignavibacterium sp.]